MKIISLPGVGPRGPTAARAILARILTIPLHHLSSPGLASIVSYQNLSSLPTVIANGMPLLLTCTPTGPVASSRPPPRSPGFHTYGISRGELVVKHIGGRKVSVPQLWY
jgi:hypothetical protein